MTDLFRSEAVEHQQQRLLGTIVLRQAWPVKALMAFFGALICALIAVFFLFGFARRETLTGRLLPEGGLIHASSAQAGLVLQVKAREGQLLQEGELLFVLSGERVGEKGGTRGRVGESLREQRTLLDGEIERAQQQAALAREALARKLEQADAQLAQLQAGVQLQRRRTEMATSAERRYAALERERAVSRQDVESRRAEAMDHAMRLHAMRREEAALVAERDSLRAELAAQPVRERREVAGIQGSLNTVRQAEAENDTSRRWEVRAPRAGRLTVVAVDAGQTVAPGELLASIAPEGAMLEAVLYAPSRAAGQLRSGMAAQVRFDALPYQKYGQFAGRVHDVSRSPVPGLEASGVATQVAAGTPLYRVRVRLDDAALRPDLAAALKAGMQLEGTLTLEYRRFYEWALEPLMGAGGRML